MMPLNTYHAVRGQCAPDGYMGSYLPALYVHTNASFLQLGQFLTDLRDLLIVVGMRMEFDGSTQWCGNL